MKRLLQDIKRFRHIALAVAALATGAAAQGPDYLVYVASEATDRISVIRFGAAGAKVEREIPVGIMPADSDGPHGLALAPDGRFLYVSTAHGTPYGRLWKFDAKTGRAVGSVELGLFPASLQVSPDGSFAYVVNFNLHGDMVPSSVSIVYTDEMIEVARVPTCTMPHGSRLTARGTKQYSTCMMDDMLVEIDAGTLAVSRHFMLAKGAEHGMAGAPKAHAAVSAGGAHGAHDAAPAMANVSCSPTWAQPTPDGSKVYVACNKSNEIVEIDAAGWTVTRRIPTGEGVYNLGITHDAKMLIATNKRGQSVSLFDTGTGKELARLATKRKIVHGVAVAPDDRYAFISVEGIGSEPGTLEIIDLAARKIVATVDVGQMAGGIDVRMEGQKGQ